MIELNQWFYKAMQKDKREAAKIGAAYVKLEITTTEAIEQFKKLAGEA